MMYNVVGLTRVEGWTVSRAENISYKRRIRKVSRLTVCKISVLINLTGWPLSVRVGQRSYKCGRRRVYFSSV